MQPARWTAFVEFSSISMRLRFDTSFQAGRTGAPDAAGRQACGRRDAEAATDGCAATFFLGRRDGRAMVDPWSAWDEHVKETGHPHRVAADLTDAELLNLLACDRAGRRGLEKDFIKQELFSRLQDARGPRR